jgi:hypothetical protein
MRPAEIVNIDLPQILLMRNLSTDTILYWEYGIVPYNFSVLFNPYISKDYGDWLDYDQFMTVRPCTTFVRKCTTVQHVTVRYRDISSQQTKVNIIFVNLEWGNFEFIFYLRSQVIGTDVPCVIEKRELLVLLHKPLEMRVWHNVGYCM